MVKAKEINQIYTDIANPGGFAGKDALFKSVKEKYPKITRKEINDFLQRNRTYTLFKDRRLHFPRSKFIPTGFMSHVHFDLADFQSLASKNKGYKYMLVGVDLLSKRVFTAPVKSKEFLEMKKAFEIAFAQMPHLPSQIFTDRGKEFESKQMIDYLENDKGIEKHRAVSSHLKAAVAERMIRTIKRRLYKYFSEKNTTNWVNVLSDLTDAINHSKSRVTGLCPIDITSDNADLVWQRVYGKYVQEEEEKTPS